MSGSISDEELMAGVQAGSRDAFEQIYARWSPALFRFLMRRTGARQNAEEALSETFLRLYRSRDAYDPSRPFRPWLYTLASRSGVDALRAERSGFRLALDALAAPVRESVLARQDARQDRPDREAELLDLMLVALSQLGPVDRRIFLLSLEDFNATEIGVMLELNPAAVRKRLSRLRASLARTLHVH